MNPCHVCNNNAETKSLSDFNVSYECKQCGNYIINIIDPPRINNRFRHLVSGYIRENQKQTMFLTQKIVNYIDNQGDLTINEKIIRILRWMEQQTSYPGEWLKERIQAYPELVAISFTHNISSVEHFFSHLHKVGFVEMDADYKAKLSIEGLKYLETDKKEVNSNLCFCAMSFSKEHTSIYEEFIKPATALAGYKSIRVDEDPHNEGIMDRIIALIHQSKFVIADLTGNKDGVYYEAGLAKGEGKEVIFTCEASEFKPHFDVQHYNLLKWERNNVDEAVQKLKWRIEGAVSRGNFKTENANSKVIEVA